MGKPSSRELGPWEAHIEDAVIDASGSGDNEIVAAVAGKSIRVVAFFMVAGAAVTAKFRSGSTDISGPLPLAANGGVSAEARHGLFQTNPGEALNLNLGSAVQVGGALTYAEV